MAKAAIWTHWGNLASPISITNTSTYTWRKDSKLVASLFHRPPTVLCWIHLPIELPLHLHSSFIPVSLPLFICLFKHRQSCLNCSKGQFYFTLSSKQLLSVKFPTESSHRQRTSQVQCQRFRYTNTEKKHAKQISVLLLKNKYNENPWYPNKYSEITQMATEYMQPDSPNIHFSNALLKLLFKIQWRTWQPVALLSAHIDGYYISCSASCWFFQMYQLV